jgi:adenine phosphoribosyltransferase
VALADHIEDIPDFPKPGIVFKDITPLFLDAGALREAVDALADYAREREVEYVVSAEARGFVLGAAVAVAVGGGFILARKPGKLPREVSSVEYQLEYGVDALEVHADAIRDGARVLVHDDLLATGGTAAALCGLVEQAGGVVAGCAFVIELGFLRGRERLSAYDVRSLIRYESEQPGISGGPGA